MAETVGAAEKKELTMDRFAAELKSLTSSLNAISEILSRDPSPEREEYIKQNANLEKEQITKRQELFELVQGAFLAFPGERKEIMRLLKIELGDAACVELLAKLYFEKLDEDVQPKRVSDTMPEETPEAVEKVLGR